MATVSVHARWLGPALVRTYDAACSLGMLPFSQVGGEWFETVMSNMNTFGRVAICGSISEYNLKEPAKVNPVSKVILFRQLTVEGFNAYRWLPKWPTAFKEITEWIQEVANVFLLINVSTNP